MPKKSSIHFAHANGFPAGCYNFFLKQLEDDFNVHAIDKLGHNPRFPITNQWVNIVEELRLSVLETQKKFDNPEPVIGIGHSLGALTTLLCAQKYPELFKQIIIIEPPISTGFDILLWRFLKTIGLQDEFSPAKASRDRQVVFQSREVVESRFKNKAFFKNFHPECFEDFLEHALESCDDGVRLSFEREYELAIFRTMPDRDSLFDTPTKMPSTIITGKSSELHRFGLLKRALKKLSYLNHYEFSAGHLVPMELPIELTAYIKDIIQKNA